jgi:hypothetical protein
MIKIETPHASGFIKGAHIRAPVISLLREVSSSMFALVPSNSGTVSKPNAKSFQLRAGSKGPAGRLVLSRHARAFSAITTETSQ